MDWCKKKSSLFCIKNAERLEQENSLHTKGIAKPKETNYEMLCTTGKSGRRSLALEGNSERSKNRKIKRASKTFGFPDITHTRNTSLRSAGTTDAAKPCHERSLQAITVFLITNKNICACLWHWFERIHWPWSHFFVFKA